MVDPVSLNNKDKIDILLAEYGTLRNEILQRNSVLNQIFAVGGSALGAIVVFAFSQVSLKGTLIGALLIFVFIPIGIFGFKIIEYDTLAAAMRIREIESAVNGMAGERLLVWETHNGLYTVSYDKRLEHLHKWIAGLAILGSSA